VISLKRSCLTLGILLLLPLFVFAGCSDSSTGVASGSVKDNFTSIQQEVFDKGCSCHQRSNPDALLNLSSGSAYNSLVGRKPENDAAKLRFGALVVPGKPDSSFLMAKITGDLKTPEGERMPQRRDKLPQDAIDAIKSWIEKGAKND